MKIFAKIFLFFYFMILALGFNNISISKDFYAISFNSIEGDKIFLSNYRNNVILVVNTASFCGFTGQFKGIQNIWEKYKSDGLIVIGVPSNSFNQELASNKEVKNFCEAKFGISFPMMQIEEVKGDNAHPFYIWAKENHGKAAVPKWNFHKIIVGKDGKIYDTFSSTTNPVSKKFIYSIETALNK